jgi:N-acetylglutamate synthase-like GNAT family acetyltransferase
MMKIISPTQEHEWKAYFQLRFDVLRDPWNQPAGSEVLSDEDHAIHAMAVDGNEALGVARMHESAPGQGQVRCVAVGMGQQGKGIGKALMIYLEDMACEKGWKEIILEARENAVPFYQAMGYSIQKESYLLFNEIQHYTMTKSLV